MAVKTIWIFVIIFLHQSCSELLGQFMPQRAPNIVPTKNYTVFSIFDGNMTTFPISFCDPLGGGCITPYNTWDYPDLFRYCFVVKWFGNISSYESGYFNISVGSDDGAWIIFNGTSLSKHWNFQSYSVTSKPVYMEAGKNYSFEVWYFQSFSVSVLYISVSPASYCSFGNGLNVEYWNYDPLWEITSTPQFRNDSVINFYSAKLWNPGTDYGTSTWRGYVLPQHDNGTELYKITVTFMYWFKLLIDDNVLIDQYSMQVQSRASIFYNFTAGKLYSIQILVLTHGVTTASLQWSYGNISQVIPASAFLLPDQFKFSDQTVILSDSINFNNGVLQNSKLTIFGSLNATSLEVSNSIFVVSGNVSISTGKLINSQIKIDGYFTFNDQLTIVMVQGQETPIVIKNCFLGNGTLVLVSPLTSEVYTIMQYNCSDIPKDQFPVQNYFAEYDSCQNVTNLVHFYQQKLVYEVSIQSTCEDKPDLLQIILSAVGGTILLLGIILGIYWWVWRRHRLHKMINSITRAQK